MKESLLTEAAKLSVPERIELIEAIWDTVAADLDRTPVLESHEVELDRRLADLEANSDAESPGKRFAPDLSGPGDSPGHYPPSSTPPPPSTLIAGLFSPRGQPPAPGSPSSAPTPRSPAPRAQPFSPRGN
ncbi:MAG TPA: addiction module protein [Thermoanaerobaculia bacterium]|nr:addiction module protein [Thermoanaerobaculia bacterium]